MFKVGQKVVCVDGSRKPDRKEPDGYRATFPTTGEIYTIREIETCLWDESLAFRLEEIVNEPAPLMSPATGKCGMFEPAFRAFRFRPINYEFGREVCESLELMTEPELV